MSIFAALNKSLKNRASESYYINKAKNAHESLRYIETPRVKGRFAKNPRRAKQERIITESATALGLSFNELNKALIEDREIKLNQSEIDCASFDPYENQSMFNATKSN